MNDLTPMQRQQLIDDIRRKHESGEQSLGMSIRRLRLEVTALDQESFAKMCKLTPRTLYALENDQGNPTLNTLHNILKPFGLSLILGLAPPLSSLPHPSEPLALPKRGSNPKRKRATAQSAAPSQKT